MKQKSTAPVPEEIIDLQRQFNEFRITHRPRTKLPENLWQAAVELARRYGLYPVAHSLRLDYVGLKKRLGEPSGVPQKLRKPPKPTFVELISSVPAPLEELYRAGVSKAEIARRLEIGRTSVRRILS